jgi:hypothetical protein
MRTTIRSITKSCKTCQVNKKWKLKYGHLPPETVITTPWRMFDMANSVTPDDINVFLDNGAWPIHSTYHTVLKASPGAATFGQDMLFDIPFIDD